MKSTSPTLASCWMGLACSWCFAFSSVAASADDFTLPAGSVASLPESFQDSIRTQAQQQANSMYSYMQLKLDELNRVCTLSGSQRIKLKVAAKGAVDYAVQDWVDLIGQQLGVQATNQVGAAAQGNVQQLQLGGRVAVPPMQAPAPVPVNVAVAQAGDARALAAAQAAMQNELAQRQALLLQQQVQAGNQNLNAAQQAQVEAEILQLQQIQQQQQQLRQQQAIQQTFVAQRMTNVVEEVVVNENGVNRVVRRVRRVPVPQAVAAAAAEQQHVWTSALESSLTPEQRKLLSESDAKRTANRAAGTTGSRLVDQIDQSLLLDPTQREKVTELVNQTLDLAAIKVQVQRTPQLTPAITDRIIKRIPAADMAEMLSPMQLTRWQQFVQSQLPAGAQGEVIGIEQIQIGPAPQPAPVLRVR